MPKRIAARDGAAVQLGDESVSATDRARVRTEVAREFFRNEHGRDPIGAREIAATIAKQSRPRTQTICWLCLTFSRGQVGVELVGAHRPTGRCPDRGGALGCDAGCAGLLKIDSSLSVRRDCSGSRIAPNGSLGASERRLLWRTRRREDDGGRAATSCPASAWRWRLNSPAHGAAPRAHHEEGCPHRNGRTLGCGRGMARPRL